MHNATASCPVCASSEVAKLGSSETEGMTVYLCVSCNDEFHTASGAGE